LLTGPLEERGATMRTARWPPKPAIRCPRDMSAASSDVPKAHGRSSVLYRAGKNRGVHPAQRAGPVHRRAEVGATSLREIHDADRQIGCRRIFGRWWRFSRRLSDRTRERPDVPEHPQACRPQPARPATTRPTRTPSRRQGPARPTSHTAFGSWPAYTEKSLATLAWLFP
jgi:hypothetical protein